MPNAVYINRFAAPPDVLYWHPRTPEHGDCVVAALSLATGVTYETALASCVQIEPDVLTVGMSWPQTRKAAKHLGFKTHVLKQGSFDLEEATGLLHVYIPSQRSKSSHAVYLWEGRILEPMYARTQLWLDAAEFIKHYKYKAGSLLVVKAKEE